MWAKNHVAIYIFISEEVFDPLTYAALCLYYKYRPLFCIDSIRPWYCLKKTFYPVFELQSYSDSFSTDKLSVI